MSEAQRIISVLSRYAAGEPDDVKRGCLQRAVVHIESQERAARLAEIEVAQARHSGRIEALNAVFQINGPSRAIARLTQKYNVEALNPQGRG